MELYKTVRAEASVPQTIERSRFIAHIRPASSREEAEDFIAQIRAQYRDATHNVPAMVLGDKAQIQWASDDGEPQGTSGAPMVQLFTGMDLTNLVIVVTRYFGGIKLGTGGLVRAYSSSAKMAVEAAGICSVCSVCRLSARIEYTFLDRIMKMASEDLSEPEAFVIADAGYGERVDLQLLCQEEDEEKIRAMLANVTSGSAQVMECSKELRKV